MELVGQTAGRTSNPGLSNVRGMQNVMLFWVLGKDVTAG